MSSSRVENTAPSASTGEGTSAGEITASAIGADGPIGKKRFPLHIAALGLVLACSAGSLYGMRYLGLGPRNSFAGEMPTIKLPEVGNRATQQRAVMEDLGSSRVNRQVGVDDIKANPFILMGKAMPRPVAAIGPVGDGRDKAKLDELKRQEAEWQRNVEADFTSMQLGAILSGSTPRARINGSIVSVGDRAGKYFTVKAINSRSVELEDDGRRPYTLELPRPR